MKVLGIDPGIERIGWGIVETRRGRQEYRRCGCIITPKTLHHIERLRRISEELSRLIRKELPDCAVVEKLFFAKNKKTALSVAESRGVILLALAQAGIAVEEFTPLEVKMGITGNGRAEKRQVAWMVKNILKIKEEIKSDDAYDALALCLMAKP